MAPEKVIVIGNGAAALAALKAYRASNGTGDVSLITDQGPRAYSPASLAKAATGTKPTRGFYITDKGFYRSLNSRLIHTTMVHGIDMRAREVNVSSFKLAFDKLLIATGSAQVIPRIVGLKDCPWFTFRTLEDLNELKENLGKSGSAVVLGAGLIGLEALEALYKLSDGAVKLALVERESQLMPKILDNEASNMLEERLKDRGIKVYKGTQVERISKSSKSGPAACKIELSSGKTLEAEMIIVATGSRPNLSVVEGTDLEMNANGIKVDELTGRTSLERVWAAGDVAISHGSESPMMLWPSAIEEGKIAGQDMAGASPGARSIEPFVPFLAARIFDLDIGFVGYPAPGQGSGSLNGSAFTDRRNNIYRRLFFREGKFSGMISLGETQFLGPAAAMVGRDISIADKGSLLSGGNAYPSKLACRLSAQTKTR